MKSNIKYSAKIEKLDGSKVKVTVTVNANEFETLFEKAKTKVLNEAKLPGFRDGKVPYDLFLKNFGELPVRQEMSYMAVDATYVRVIVDEKIEALGQPQIEIGNLPTKEGGEFEYTFTTDVLPQVELGDYKKYHTTFKLEEFKKATEDEINDALEELRKMRAKKVKNEDGTEHDELPEINEEFLKSVGDFKTLEDLKKRISDNIDGEKRWRAEEKRKGEILDALVQDTKTEIPESLIKNELSKIEQRITADLAQMGVTLDDYLKHLKKTKEEWYDTEKENAKKQVIIQLALIAISKKENIHVSEEAVRHEVAHLTAQYKDIDPERAKVYSEERMTNSLVAEYLFTGKIPDEKEIFGDHSGHNH